MAEMIEKKCQNCKAPMQVRLADHERGWGKFCSKSCKAKRQMKMTGIAGPDYRASGQSVQQMQNGKYAKSQFKRHDGISPMKHKKCAQCGEPAVNGVIWNGEVTWYCMAHLDNTHPFSSDALGQW